MCEFIRVTKLSVNKNTGKLSEHDGTDIYIRKDSIMTVEIGKITFNKKINEPEISPIFPTCITTNTNEVISVKESIAEVIDLLTK